MPELFPVETVAAKSALRIEGALAQRRLLSPPELPAWMKPDLLVASVVQLLVDASGKTISAVLLPPGNGYNDADQAALSLARSARFEPLADSPTNLTVGTLTFEWQTLPMPATNAPPVLP